MKTIDADELIKALEKEYDAAVLEFNKAATHTELKEWEGYVSGLDTALYTARKLAKQADNVGELPY